MILETINLSKSFGLRKAVDGLSLQIPDGSVYGFLGPNGCGKSTTIRMMTALISPDEGEVFIQGNSVQKLGNKALSSVGALIERADFHKHLSGETNLKMLARMDGTDMSRVQTVLDRTGLGNRGKDKVKTYSQGMKQRLGIAQALLSRPKLLILDEPTNGLDPQGMKEVRDLICELSSEGITIFISSHLLDEVQKICSHVAMISFGKLITSGKMENLLQESDLLMTEVQVDNVEKSAQLLSALEWVHRCDAVDGVLHVGIGLNKASDLVQYLVQKDIRVSAVIPKTSLEDLYLSKFGMKNKI
ncbi:MAG: ATP-binding cassette domain-containing protein [Candidatus Marinimicrobia bacterium]|jgi:ABC-type multidrug transport system ATPase subunit|nr:ATP-binding cassette domain-containing protein [Candidatus Neomarinimicrobiota bacterium]MBT3675668.1 ATP-binding cassette domain-containing protein [Candidatus Neomarinimicrobiota bacterium]MBT3764075.1 ATP-binding cassette domain-containing protein [Candidatus Neomarinimicrobiota bacterium]MBT4069087.1 ATP-binding cassette domain-containing protein [Candidatus Neomarinimicrobiota bacterium]MBT4270954.1 ATP-binding cassette domain-containing protein [Candidatus Neomarinimicrobiota bacterium